MCMDNSHLDTPLIYLLVVYSYSIRLFERQKDNKNQQQIGIRISKTGKVDFLFFFFCFTSFYVRYR